MLGFFKKKTAESLPGLLTTKAAQKGVKPTFHSAKVLEVRRETADCVSVALEVPNAETFSFVPGQYLTLRSTINGQEVRRSYSLCSSPLSGELRVAIKQVEEGIFSTWANTELKAGDTLETMPPMGNFALEIEPTDEQTYVGFAAGSGITPVLSILKTVLERAPKAKFILFYGNRKTNSIIFKAELEDLKDAHMGRLEVHHVLSREDQGNDLLFGRIDETRAAQFAAQIPSVKEAAGHFLCGPEAMIKGVQSALEQAGVSAKNIHFELFTSAAPLADKTAAASTSSGDAAVTIILDGEETHFTQGPKDFILDSALDAGADVPYACKGAVCCTCRAKVLEGEVEMAMNYSLTDDEVAEGYILTCQSMPRSPKVTVSFDE
ncbi:MAG: 1,2-phenylacetyl-CoA epoxidase subunit PaaE [Schleiferiaceae bacterium]|jgi:ring-1,2-phenylacetyl-CoA epoxidase subunit PaaE